MEQANLKPMSKSKEYLSTRHRLFEFAISHSLEELIQKTMDEVYALTRISESCYFGLDDAPDGWFNALPEYTQHGEIRIYLLYNSDCKGREKRYYRGPGGGSG